MSKNFYLAPASPDAGLTSVSLGLVLALQSLGLRAGYFKPISRSSEKEDRSLAFAREILNIDAPNAISIKDAQDLINDGEQSLLMEKVIENYLKIKNEFDIIVVEGLIADDNDAQAAKLNVSIAGNIDSEVMIVAAENGLTQEELDHHIRLAAGLFASPEDPDVLGVILNKVGAPRSDEFIPFAFSETVDNPAKKDIVCIKDFAAQSKVLSDRFHLIGSIPFNTAVAAPRVIDLVKQLDIDVIEEGAIEQRRLKQVLIVSANVQSILHKLSPGTLVVCSNNRVDVMLAASMAAMNGVELAGIVLTGDLDINEQIRTFCGQAFATGLPVLSVPKDTYRLAYEISHFNSEAAADDTERMRMSMNLIADSLDITWIDKQCQVPRESKLSPPAFRFQLSERSRAAAKTIILPEGDEPRTICAATICHERRLANCILVGKPQEIRNVAALQGVEIPDDLKIIDPDDVRENYVAPMVELRKHKGLTPQMALAQLEDNVVLATMMVALDEVDGLVSGAVNTTANTVRPALQLIKTSPKAKVVSSVFFMCLPEQVVVYGDCAINPDPNAEELADIAIQSTDSALAFGIEPKVAMISYSTGTSGSGDDVDKVRKATELAKEKRPDLLIDGPLQYDAATVDSVAKKKAPGSPVAGKATVFVFPDLNTGNTTYKAVQRSANVISVGPMLQGLNKPVNDLSRGALVEDIVFTIALTAVQAKQVADLKENS